MWRIFFVVFVLLFHSVLGAAVPEALVELHQRGFAELENELPEKAEATYAELASKLRGDPLAHANLAIAQLRQQKNVEALASIDKALGLAKGRADLLAIKGEVQQWSGELDSALETLKAAGKADPDDPEILYSLYQLATTLDSESAQQAATTTLERLVELRPDNVVVLLQLGQQAIAQKQRGLATAAFLRLGELLWQAQPIALRAMEKVEEALETDDLASARVPALRFENVLKVSPMFRESLRELKTGIQGIPVRHFIDREESSDFGEPLDVRFAGTALDTRPTRGRALGVGDFDGDERPDLARIRAEGEGKLEIRLAAGAWAVSHELPAGGFDELLVADIDNDGHLDLLAFGTKGGGVWLGQGDGSFAAAPDQHGLGAASATAATLIDFDIEGDLDLALALPGEGAADLYRNSLEGPLERIGERSLPRLALAGARAIVPSDLDRDGDLDLLLGHAQGFTWLDNLRQGRFVERGREAGLGPASAVDAARAIDLDNDGFPDLVAAGKGLAAWHNEGGRFEAWPLPGLPREGRFEALIAFDADNDGRLDLAAAGDAGLLVLGQRQSALVSLPLEGAPKGARALAAADLDGDGDLDLVAAGEQGLHRLENQGGHRNGWLQVRLRGLAKGNSKNNLFGVGSVVEVRNGRAFQFREAEGDVLHLGLGKDTEAEVLRVVWTNGVPQNRLRLEGKQRIVEEQLLKGSCPFLYAWDGEGYSFVTDLLWGAPLGLPVAPGAWAPSDPSELVRIDGLVPRDGRYELRLTEELWEAAFFDLVRLWVVDHPREVEVASNLRIAPEGTHPDRVLGSRDVRPVAAAWDGRGREVSERVRERDEIYADGYPASAYQGVADRPWTFTFDLGAAPGGPVRLHLDGWIFPADASLNLAVAQRGDLPYLPPRLEVETPDGWQVLMPATGFPAGKTKTLVIDTPPLPEGARKLRFVTSLWLHWDRIAWTAQADDDAVRVRERLAPSVAELRYRGFSAMSRKAPNAPHHFDYENVSQESPWLPFPGHYTRYGEVGQLLDEADDLSVIMAPGDELALSFEASSLPPLGEGWTRTLFLESHGWDKDADRNTFAAEQLEPLPFRAMSGYPYGADESYPNTRVHRRYQRQWLTRELE